jgi:polysaccharide export outer membrane protein
LAATLLALLVGTGTAAAQPTDYVIGPQDELTVTVWNQEDLGGDYMVGADGTFTFPLVGRVTASGLTVAEFEAELTRRLADGFFDAPQVSVTVDGFNSQRVFVLGQVRAPGTYPLTTGMTLIEALATAGSTTEAASNEAIIVTVQTGSEAAEGALPDQSAAAAVLSFDIEQLQTGRSRRNVSLRDGDTIYVPRADTVFVSGEVAAPGEYPIRHTTTVLQALALAGGATEFGATNRILAIRIVNGEPQEVRVEFNDIVQAGDTLVVPERFF